MDVITATVCVIERTQRSGIDTVKSHTRPKTPQSRVILALFRMVFVTEWSQMNHRLHCVLSLSKTHESSLVLVQPTKTHPHITTESLIMGFKESNQTKRLQMTA